MCTLIIHSCLPFNSSSSKISSTSLGSLFRLQSELKCVHHVLTERNQIVDGKLFFHHYITMLYTYTDKATAYYSLTTQKTTLNEANAMTMRS